MARSRRNHFESFGKRTLDNVAMTAYTATLAVPAGVAALGSMIDPATRSLNPIYTQYRDGRPMRKIRTLQKFAEEGKMYQDDVAKLDKSSDPQLVLHGPCDPRASAYGKLVRKIGIDEYPQLVCDFRLLSFYGLRRQLDEEKDRFRDADAAMFDEMEDKRQEYGVKPAMVSSSSIWRRGLENPMSPDACLRSMEMDLEYLDDWSLAREAWAASTVLAVVGAKLLLPKQTYQHGQIFEQFMPEPLQTGDMLPDLS